MQNTKIYKKILLLAIPITLENLIYSFINFVDVFMVGRENETLGLGANAISALGISNQFFFLFMTSLFGFLSGASILSSQYYGAKDFKNLRKLSILFVGFSFIYSMLFFIAGYFFPNIILGLYTKDISVIDLGMKYLKIIIWTYPITAIGFAFSMMLRSVNLPKLSLYTAFLGLIVNIALNMFLIPVYGVQGAAIATLIARVGSTLFLLGIILLRSKEIIPSLKDFFGINFKFVKAFFAVSIITFLHEMLWSLAMSIKAAFYGKMGTLAFSSIQIANNINSLLFTIFIGLTIATSVMVGNELGKDNIDKVFEFTKKIIRIYTAILFVVIVLLNIMAPFILQFMGVNKEVYHLTITIIYSLSITSSLVAYTMLFLIGILRAGGDVKFAIMVELIPLWFISLPVTYAITIIYPRYFTPLPVAIVFLISYVEELIMLVPCMYRYYSKKWINKII